MLPMPKTFATSMMPIPTHLHVIARHFGCRGHEFTPLLHRNARHVVSYKAVAALNQPQQHLLLPMPLTPRINTPTPKISTMLPNSVTVGEKSISRAIVAALMNFIVIIGVRNTAIFASPVTPSNSGADETRATSQDTEFCVCISYKTARCALWQVNFSDKNVPPRPAPAHVSRRNRCRTPTARVQAY